MLIQSIEVRGVRNLASATLHPSSRFNVLSGDNGQGKTNIIEAIYAVCTLRSFRTSRLRELIAIDGEQAYIGAEVERLELSRKYELTIKERSRVVRLDEKAVRPIARYFGHFNVVLFAPEDLLVARGSPSDRRRFLDRAIFTMNPSFLGTAQNFEKVLKNRNVTLRDEHMPFAAKNDLLAVYDQQLASLSAQVVRARLEYLAKIRPHFEEAFDAITQSGLEASLHYASTVEGFADMDGEAAQREALDRSRARDLARGATSVGPHRDVLGFLLADQPAASFASQGQLRAMVLAWKTAEMELLAKTHEESPVLLLDDVSSELDPTRNEYLFAFLRRAKHQCFITTTHPDYVLLDAERADFRVENGRVQSV